MNFEDLKQIYDDRRKQNPKAYEEITSILEEAKDQFKSDRLKEKPGIDIEQAWRSWKGNNFERLVHYIVSDMIKRELPLEVISGSVFKGKTLDKKLGKIKRNLLVDFGLHGSFVPDADIVVYSPLDGKVIAIISCKITLRERIAQSGFWKLRLKEDAITSHIKVLFVTPDEDETLVSEKANKSKAIALDTLDGAYVMRRNIVQNHNLMTLDKLVEELRKCL